MLIARPARALVLVTVSLTVLSIAGAADETVRTKTAPPTTTSGLQLRKWSGDVNVPDPVAVTVDPNGVVYATQTTRRKQDDLDIREHPQWIPFDIALEDIDQKKAFLHDVLAPGKLTHPEGDLRDHNHDGSIDWKDLTVHSEKIWKLEDTKGAGVADRGTLFAEGFNTEVTGIAAGVMWYDGWVYTTIAPDLWRLRDTNGSGVANEREIVVHGFGHHIAYAGHDMHGLRVGPDGRIYWTIGDKGVNVHTKDGRHVAEPHQGCVLRCEPDGTGFEVFAHGLRNLQEIAFNEHGDIFGVDNDADKPGERERIVNVVEHSDSGWRCYYQYITGWSPWMDEGLWKVRHTGQPAYITPPLVNDHDGPAGFACNPGTALSPAWKGWCFVNQFPKGEMAAIRFEPDGPTYKVAEDKVITRGVMGIGMSWSPDGKLYMADWGGGYPLKGHGAVWTLDDPRGADNSVRRETYHLLHDGFSQRESSTLVKLLGHEDQRVRVGAQFEMVKRGEFAALQMVALDTKQAHLARIHALWGLGQGWRSQKIGQTEGAALLKVLRNDKDAEVRAQLVKVLGDAANCASLGGDLVPFLSDASPRVRFQTGIAIGKMKVPSAVKALLHWAETNNDVDAYQRHAIVSGLETCATPDQLAETLTHNSAAVRLAATLALRRQGSPLIAKFLQDKNLEIATEAARAIHDDLSIPEALPALAAMADDIREDLPDPLVRRALNAAFRLGGASNAERLMKFGLREAAPKDLRVLALSLAKQWAEPPPLDNVDGRARKLEARDPSVLAKTIEPRMHNLLDLKDADLKTLGIQLLTTYQLPVPANLCVAAVMAPEAPGEVRAEAMTLLAKQHTASPELTHTLESLFGSAKTPDVLLVSALDAAFLRNKAEAVAAATRVLTSDKVLAKQHAFAILAQAASEKADATLAENMQALTAGKLPVPMQLDLLEAVQARSQAVPVLREKLAAFEAARAAAIGTPAAFSECLEGGSPALGKKVALENLASNCTACHRFDKREGSNVGPPLDKIGSARDRAYLLESLILPNAKIAPGFGIVAVTLKSGEVVSGALASTNAKTKDIEIRLADNTLQSIAAADIQSKTEPVSVMPPMGAILTKRQIRDVISFLSSQKAPAKKKKEKETETTPITPQS